MCILVLMCIHIVQQTLHCWSHFQVHWSRAMVYIDICDGAITVVYISYSFLIMRNVQPLALIKIDMRHFSHK